ncbi:MAG TPA: glycosyltransferase family 2 protein [Nitrospirota bacterium]|nr:glycosyltransferase family 2 protein [Nitrospirota bacterium]
MKIVVILPTYNEKDNIALIIRALQEQFTKMPHDMNILVVDDNSPDGTAERVRAESKTAPNIFLLTGQKQGLGAAYVRGMKYAINELQAEAVMEMDADFSHKPEYVPRLIEAVDRGADFVIGSRYVPGGKIPEDWSFLRRMISQWGNVFARYIAGLYQVRDCTAGFRAIRAAVIKKIDLDALKVRGYAFQISLLHEAIVNQARVQEVPVEFVDRKRGQTKLGLSDIVEFMLNAWWIRFERSKTFLKFSVVGAAGVVVNLASFTVLLNLGMNKFIASPVAIEISIIFNFFLNNFWTFSDRDVNDKIHIRGMKFNIISFVALGVSYSTFLILSVVDPGGVPQVHQAIGIIPATLINYFLNSYWTFKDK